MSNKYPISLQSRWGKENIPRYNIPACSVIGILEFFSESDHLTHQLEWTWLIALKKKKNLV